MTTKKQGGMPSIQLLSAYLDENLPAKHRSQVVSAILASPVTQERLSELQTIRRALSAPLRSEPKIDVTAAVMAAIAQRGVAPANQPSPRWSAREVAHLLVKAAAYAYCSATGADARGGAATVLEEPFLSWTGPPMQTT